MTEVLMPKATAIWLVENTALTFDQIALFTGLHRLEVQAIADGDSVGSLKGYDPIASGQLSKDEIDKGEADSQYVMQLLKRNDYQIRRRSKGPRYTPIAKRQDKPDAILWILRNHPELSENQIIRLIGTTKNTIGAIKNKSHWNMANLKAQHPVDLGLCKLSKLTEEVKKAKERNKSLAPAAEEVTESA